jgi:hypothetical protein
LARTRHRTHCPDRSAQRCSLTRRHRRSHLQRQGQRLQIDYKNGASTSYTYDSLTFRLTQLQTRRDPTAFPGDNAQPLVSGWPGSLIQNLNYTCDPVGNIIHIRDDS